MDKNFIYCQNPDLISLLEKTLTVVSKNNTGCYFLNDNKFNSLNFDDESLNKMDILFTNSINLEG